MLEHSPSKKIAVSKSMYSREASLTDDDDSGVVVSRVLWAGDSRTDEDTFVNDGCSCENNKNRKCHSSDLRNQPLPAVSILTEGYHVDHSENVIHAPSVIRGSIVTQPVANQQSIGTEIQTENLSNNKLNDDFKNRHVSFRPPIHFRSLEMISQGDVSHSQANRSFPYPNNSTISYSVAQSNRHPQEKQNCSSPIDSNIYDYRPPVFDPFKDAQSVYSAPPGAHLRFGMDGLVSRPVLDSARGSMSLRCRNWLTSEDRSERQNTTTSGRQPLSEVSLSLPWNESSKSQLQAYRLDPFSNRLDLLSHDDIDQSICGRSDSNDTLDQLQSRRALLSRGSISLFGDGDDWASQTVESRRRRRSVLSLRPSRTITRQWRWSCCVTRFANKMLRRMKWLKN